MGKETHVVIVEDDGGHATLITRNLKRAGVNNRIVLLKDGQEAIDFFTKKGKGPHRQSNTKYILILDLRLPRVNGTEVLRRLRKDKELLKMPVIVLTTTDDEREVENCYKLGCNNYMTKPVEYDSFKDAVQSLGHFISVLKLPQVNGMH